MCVINVYLYKIQKVYPDTIQAGTWRLYNVASTSMQGHMTLHDLASTLIWCSLNVASPLGPLQQKASRTERKNSSKVSI